MQDPANTCLWIWKKSILWVWEAAYSIMCISQPIECCAHTCIIENARQPVCEVLYKSKVSGHLAIWASAWWFQSMLYIKLFSLPSIYWCPSSCRNLRHKNYGAAGVVQFKRKLKEHHNTRFWKAQRKITMISGWLLSAFFIFCCLSLCLFPQQTRSHLPHPQSTWMLSGASSVPKAADFALPNSKSAAYDLGYITREAENTLSPRDPFKVRHAAKLLRLPEAEINIRVLKSVGNAIRDNDKNGLEANSRGVFSFVSVAWTLAALGLAVSIIPVYRNFSTSIVRVMSQSSPSLLIFIIDCLTILKPAAHASFFGLSFYIIAAAARYPIDYNRFIALSGCLLSIPAFEWSTARSTTKEMPSFEEYSDFSRAIFTSLVLAPTAVAYQSSLLGFLAVGAFFQAIGLCCVPLGLGWVVGFGNRNDLYQVAAASFVILQALVLAQIFGMDHRLLHLFHSGGQVFGSIGLFLAGLIETSSNRYHRSEFTFYMLNFGFFALLLSFVLAGSVLNLASLYNTGIVFLVLYLVEKVIELGIRSAFWYTIFGASIALWQIALWLHGHPQFVEAMFVL